MRADRRLHALLAPILANNLLDPLGTEEQDVLEIVLKENNLKLTGTVKPKDSQKIKKEVIAYSKSLARMRELFTYYILYAFGILCNPQTVDQLKVLQQQHFLSAAYEAAPDATKPPYTAQVAIDYLQNECHTDNENIIKSLNRELERMIRCRHDSIFSLPTSVSTPCERPSYG